MSSRSQTKALSHARSWQVSVFLSCQTAVLAGHATKAKDRTCRRWPTKLHVWPEVREANRIKSKVRSRVERVFKTLKLNFGFTKVRYRGLARICTGYRSASPWSTSPPPETPGVSGQ